MREGPASTHTAAASAVVSAKQKLDELFLTWIASTGSVDFVEELIKASAVSSAPGSPLLVALNSPSLTSSPSLSSLDDSAFTLSPKKNTRGQKLTSSPKRYNRYRSGGAHARHNSHAGTGSEEEVDDEEPNKKQPRVEIPRFYFPSGQPGQAQKDESGLAQLKNAYYEYQCDEMPREDLVPVLEKIAGIPPTICKLLLVQNGLDANIKEEAAVRMWRLNIAGRDPSTILFDALRQPYATTLQHADFRTLVRVMLDNHPGLAFLQNTAEFQERYLETVVVRIFYTSRRGYTGRITLRDLRASGLVNMLAAADAEQDINKGASIFSYEHFYVIYCKFWELDKDHDLIIDADDLCRYGGGVLTRRVAERIASMPVLPRDIDLARIVAARAKRVRAPARLMTYQDFVWFILSEEDKTTAAAQEYWFRIIDTDGDGYWSVFELEHFYHSSAPRLQSLGMDLPPFADLLCQWLDMLSPQYVQLDQRVSLKDLRGCKLGPAILNALVSPTKYVAMETKDPFAVDGADCGSDWVRFAQIEYEYAVAEHESSG